MSTGQVTVTINGIDYPMACAPGEEAKVMALGAKIDEVARQVASASGPIGEARILVMAALIMSDKMADLEDKLSHDGPPDAPAGAPVDAPADLAAQVDTEKLAALVDGLTARLEKLASR